MESQNFVTSTRAEWQQNVKDRSTSVLSGFSSFGLPKNHPILRHTPLKHLGLLLVGSLFLSIFTAQQSFAQNAERGADLAAQHCQRCHFLTPKLSGTDIGPSLKGVFGREPGTGTAGPTAANNSKDLYPYGEDFKKAASQNPWAWNNQTLDNYIKDPTQFLRNQLRKRDARSKMTYKIPDAKDRADIIAYLKTLK